MLRYISFIILALVISKGVNASPFSGLEESLEASKLCKYSEVYSVSQKTYLIFNMIEKLSLKKEELTFRSQSVVNDAAEEVVNECKSSQKIELSKIGFKDDRLTFEYGSGKHSVEWIVKDEVDYVVYKRLYGTYKGEPLMVLKYKDTKNKVFTRVTGRYGSDESLARYTFFYSNKTNKIISRLKLEGKNSKAIKSLKTIYGEEVVKSAPKIRVGVVGTGLDYNQPGMAKHLAYRFAMEKDLQKIEALDKKLREDPFVEKDQYKSYDQQLKKLKPKVGFPKWMDQALGTSEPYDTVIVDKKKSAGPTKEHETRVTSRMLRTGGAVEVHFARRSMGSIDDLNVTEVMGKFADKGVRIVNLSFGSSCGRLPKEEKMWAEAFERYPEIVFVVSAGNSGRDTSYTPFCPAVFSKDFNNVISVTALSPEGQLAAYFGTPVNFGKDVDLAIKADNLEVLVPYRKKLKWENNANGATSLAAAEVSRILTETILEGLDWNAQTVKEALVQSSDYSSVLEGVNRTSSEVNETAFREVLMKNNRQGFQALY